MKPIKISKIRTYRYALGKTQKEMSELLNIHHVVYGRKERMLVAFTDKEKVTLLNYFKEYFPNETIYSLFFWNSSTEKYKNLSSIQLPNQTT